MADQFKQERRDLPLILTALTLVLFASPLIYWWSASNSTWFLPYILWSLVILLGAYLQWRRQGEK